MDDTLRPSWLTEKPMEDDPAALLMKAPRVSLCVLARREQKTSCQIRYRSTRISLSLSLSLLSRRIHLNNSIARIYGSSSKQQ